MTVRGVSTNECPTSLISEFSETVIDLVERATLVKEITPIFDKGSELPAKLIDAFEIIELERRRADNAIEDYKHNRSQIQSHDVIIDA